MEQVPASAPVDTGNFGLTFWTQVILLTFFLVAGLVYGASVLIPLALSILLIVLISAIVDRICRFDIAGYNIPVWLGYVLAFAIVLSGLLGVLSILSSQASAVAEAVPRYEQRLASILARFAALIGDQNYVAVQDSFSSLSIADFVRGIASSAGSFLSLLGLVILFIPFMLVERAPMRKKLVLAVPDPEMREKAHHILEGMSASLQQYIGIKTFVSLITGTASYAVMKPVGLDFPETWAVLIFALNFIPTVGSIIGTAIPSLVALVQFDTFTPFLIIAGGCGVIQFSIGNVLEPALTGRTLNLSPLMVILSLTVWSAIWGIAGALLSVPLTVCIMIMLSFFPATRSLAIFMSRDGTLMAQSPEAADSQLEESLVRDGSETEQKG